ncbi:LysR family transcriptional regulator [Ideonella livida]|uniref:LysR family transcriptional regulator n=1 Tax=Ideonella livida TaxID=2707176 RepID=A0A7C9PJ43_9BURK|nr:LysR family transcriptional regulator [Ideonella livida]NDY92474.1 LysR family transcriptional regulator [Ideonella livida]
MDRLTAAQVFVEVADSGSLTRAAERLDMSAAMVSRYLAAAEDWLGARLLHRTTRRISLTEAGQTALASTRAWLELAEDMRQRAGDGRREPQARLRVSTSASFADAQLTAAVVDFRALHPRVQVELLASDRAVDLVEDRIDLAVRISRQLDPALLSRPLAVCRSVLCAAPGYVTRHGLPRTPAELADHRHLTHAHGSGTTYRLAPVPPAQGPVSTVGVQGELATNETAVLRRAALLGAGIAMLPTYYVAEDLARGALVRLLPDHEPEVLGVYAVYLSRRHQPLALRLLVDFLAARFGGPVAPWDRPAEA